MSSLQPARSGLRLAALSIACSLGAAQAQAPAKPDKPTEAVVRRYLLLVSNGSLLTADGWERARSLYDRFGPFPARGVIALQTLGNLGEMWSRNNHAEVQTKWTDALGSIGPDLRYKPPPQPRPSMTSFLYQLVYTNKHQDLDASGRVIQETVGPWEWKLVGPPSIRWTTVDSAIPYLSNLRDNSHNPNVIRRADKTLRILRRLVLACGTNSAC